VVEIPAAATVAIVGVALSAVIVYEVTHYAELRDKMRHQLAGQG
jgi:hypothetical protein